MAVLSNTGIIDRADQAVQLTNEKQVQDLAAMIWSEKYMDKYRGEDLTREVLEELEAEGITADDWNITITDTGVSVSKKNGKAHLRNKIKRLIRENYRIQVKEKILKGYDFVFVWNKNRNIKNANYKNIKEDFENIFKRTGILIDEKNINKNDIDI